MIRALAHAGDSAWRASARLRLREPVNGLTHCIAAVLAFIGLILLMREAAYPFKPWHFIAFAVYGVSMILLYAASTVYHWLPMEDDETSGFRRLDHIMIFVFIAATYTPICLIPLREACGFTLLLCIWTFAILGGASKLYWIRTPRWITTLEYLLTASCALVCFDPITRALPGEVLFWLAAGGAAYCTGALVYALGRPDPFPNAFGSHEIFHLFVMLGSSAHFWAIYRYIASID